MPAWLNQFVADALIYVGLATVFLLGLMLHSPRMMLQDYPPSIKTTVPPKTDAEKRHSLWFGLPFLLLLLVYPIYATAVFHAHGGGEVSFASSWIYAFGLAFAFNVWDWLIIDWFVFCAITPKWVVIPGSEGHPGYKDYWFHFRGFLIGTAFSVVSGLVSAVIVTVLA
jgi:hypothetical protein